MRSLAALLPFPKIMKIFNIPFPQRQILHRPPHRRPPVPPLQYRLRTAAHLSPPCGIASASPPTHSSPKHPPNRPSNLSRCPIFRPTCPEIPLQPLPVSHFPPHLSRNPRPTVPGVPFSAPPVLEFPSRLARCPISGPTCPEIPLQPLPVSRLRHHQGGLEGEKGSIDNAVDEKGRGILRKSEEARSLRVS